MLKSIDNLFYQAFKKYSSRALHSFNYWSKTIIINTFIVMKLVGRKTSIYRLAQGDEYVAAEKVETVHIRNLRLSPNRWFTVFALILLLLCWCNCTLSL